MATRTGSGLHLRKRELFRSLGYEPHPGQEAVHRSKALRRVCACGSRWGKSVCAAYEAVAALMAPAESSLGWTIAPTYDLSDRVFKRVVKTFNEKLPHRIVHYNPREHGLVVRNLGGGLSELRGKTADRPVSLLGEGLDFVIVDEAAKLPQEIWEEHVSQRLIDRRGWCLMVSTPHGLNWFYRAFRLGQKGRDADYESWASPSQANPHLDAAVIEAERARLPADTFGEQYEAAFVGAMQEPCDVCGGPSPDVGGMVVIHGRGEPPKCPECGEAVDDEGRTVVCLAPNGQPILRILNLIPGRPDDIIEPMPGCHEDPDDPATPTSADASEHVGPRVERDFFKHRAS